MRPASVFRPTGKRQQTFTGTSPDMAFVRSLSEDPAVTEHMKSIESTIIKAMLQSGLVQKIGKAPAGGMETSIRKHIG